MEANPPTSAPALGLGRLIRDIMDVIIDGEDAETMTDVWESAWDRLNETFRRVASSLSSSYPDMTWSAGHSDNEAFPFRAYATFNRGWPESADVVTSVDFHRLSNG